MSTPLLPTDKRLVEIIRGYIATNSDNLTCPDMNSEIHQLELLHVVLDEVKALAQGEVKMEQQAPEHIHEIALRVSCRMMDERGGFTIDTQEDLEAFSQVLVNRVFAEFQKLQGTKLDSMRLLNQADTIRLQDARIAVLEKLVALRDRMLSARIAERDELAIELAAMEDAAERWRTEGDELAAKLKETEHLLKDLLAVMHRDGGHHAFAVGLEQAVEDAKEIYFAFRDASDKLKLLEEQEPVVIEAPDYHQEAMGCGLEDRGIRDRYEAMLYGWECAIERMLEQIPEGPLYAAPVTSEDKRDAEHPQLNRAE